MRKLISFITSIVLVMSLTGSVLATEPNFGGEGNFNSGDVCGGAQQVNLVDLSVNEDGWRILTVSGSHHQGFHRVDASGNAVTGELDTILPAGTYFVAPDVLGTGWTYTAGCDPTDMVNAHIARRVADPTVNTQGMLVLPDEYPQVYELFVPVDEAPVASGADFGSTTDTVVMDPAPATYVAPETATTLVAPTTETVVTTTPVIDPNMGLCPTDVTVYGDLLGSCIDDTNPVAVAGNCFIHQEYLQEGGPEVSTAGPYASVRYTMKNGGLRWVLLPHGIYNVASRLPDDAWVAEYGVNCLFTEVLAFITADMQSQQNQGAEIATTSLVDWNHSNGLFGLEDNTLPYFGGTVDPDTDTTCHAEKAKGGIMDRRSVIGKEGFFTLVEPWAPGLAPEYNSVLDPGVWHLSNNVHGSFWYYSKEFCDRGQVEAQARAEANRRKKHGNVGYFENANHFGAFFSR